MLNTLIPIVISISILLTNYIVFGYGVRVGKTMQKEISPSPIVETVKKVYKMAKRTAEEKEQKKREDPGKQSLGMYD